MALAFVLGTDRRLERLLLGGGPGFLHIVLLALGEHGSSLLAAHDRYPCIGPHPEEARAIGAPAHAVIAGSEAAADDQRQLWHAGAGDSRDHLGPVLGDAAGLIFAADHETSDILQENERNTALGAELDEMCTLESGFGEQDTIVGDDTDGIAI